MSKVKRTVELQPPKYDQSKELLTSPGHVCGYCHGRGYFSGLYEENETICPVCDGAGQVDAIITVEWKPGKKE